MAWSPDGKRIASGGLDVKAGVVQVWDAVDGGHVFTYRGHSGEVRSVAWLSIGTCIASAGTDHIPRVWDAATGTSISTYRGHSDTVWAVAWSPDGKRIAASGSSDTTVEVWNPADSSHVYTYTGHSAFVGSIAWSPDSKHIASASGDNTGFANHIESAPALNITQPTVRVSLLLTGIQTVLKQPIERRPIHVISP